MITKKVKCLLVKLADERIFFTSKTNYQNLLEFANVCNAKLKIVEAVNPPLVSLRDLVTNICDPNNKTASTYYEVSKDKENEPRTKHYYTQYTTFSKLSNKQKTLKKISNIRDFILSQFKSGITVRVKDMAKKLKKHDLSVSTLYRHVNFVKDQLISEGKTVTKIAPGSYRLN